MGYVVVIQEQTFPIQVDLGDGERRVIAVLVLWTIKAESKRTSLVQRPSEYIQQTLR